MGNKNERAAHEEKTIPKGPKFMRIPGKHDPIEWQPSFRNNAAWINGRSEKQIELAFKKGQYKYPWTMICLIRGVRKLNAIAMSLGLRLIDVGGRGWCLYHAVFACLYCLDLHQDEDGFKLHERCMDFVEATPDLMEDVAMFCAFDDMTPDEYMRRSRAVKEQPGTVMIKALSIMLNVHIDLYTGWADEAQEFQPRIPEESRGKISIGNYYDRRADSGHYMAMIPRVSDVGDDFSFDNPLGRPGGDSVAKSPKKSPTKSTQITGASKPLHFEDDYLNM